MSLSNLPAFLRGPGDRPFRVLIALSGLTVAFTFFMLAAVLILSANRSDQLSQARLHQVVEYALTKSIERVPYDQESVAVWDDAVKFVKGIDLKWVDINLGVWMYEYFKHDRSYVLNAEDQVLYSMADGKQVSVSRRLPLGKIPEVMAELRERIRSGELDRYERGQQRVPRALDLGYVDGRPAIISSMPLVSDTGEVPQARGTESVIVSIRFLDNTFLQDLADAYLLKGVRFSTTNNLTSGEQSYPLRNVAGASVGYFIWKPVLPGSTILSDLGPLFGIGSLLVGIAVLLLMRSLRGTCTELVVSEAHSKHLAYHDVLTGLPNRAYFDDRLEQYLSEVRAGSGQLALLFLDLDRFKEVNDTFGHAVGDALIREVTAQLSAVISPGDELARMGGDEFAVIKRARSKDEVIEFCALIAATVTRPFEINGLKVAVGVSIGVAMAPEGEQTAESWRARRTLLCTAPKKALPSASNFLTRRWGRRSRRAASWKRSFGRALIRA